MNKEIILFGSFISLISITLAQGKYDPNKYLLSCIVNDSMSIVITQAYMDSIILSENIEDKEMFQYQYAMLYSKRYYKWYQTDDLKKSLSYFEKNWLEYKNLESLKNLTQYVQLDECDKALHYLNIYIDKATELNLEVNYKSSYLIYRSCKDR